MSELPEPDSLPPPPARLDLSPSFWAEFVAHAREHRAADLGLGFASFGAPGMC